MTKQVLLKFTCEDTFGIIAAVTTFLSQQNAFISELSEFGDPTTKRFFLRCPFELRGEVTDIATLSKLFEPIANRFKAQWQFIEPTYRPKTVILVSKFSHCLNDLLYRQQVNRLSMDIKAVISNHPDLEGMVNNYEIPFHYFPVDRDNKSQQEEKILSLIESEQIELVILARYMQILSPAFTEKMPGKIINIHHSFLPSFIGAKPYHQAFDRGVKIIGATAHYVTAQLDEGPIIEQEILRVGQIRHPDELVFLGFDIETQVLARAVKFHTENRIFINGNKTVIFK